MRPGKRLGFLLVSEPDARRTVESSCRMASTTAWGRSMRALRSRNYWLFFTGQSVSLIGTWMTHWPNFLEAELVAKFRMAGHPGLERGSPQRGVIIARGIVHPHGFPFCIQLYLSDWYRNPRSGVATLRMEWLLALVFRYRRRRDHRTEVGSLVYFFASDEAGAITGPAFSIDGGTLA